MDGSHDPGRRAWMDKLEILRGDKMKENAVTKWFVGIAFTAFLLAVIGWTASLTLGVMETVLPHSPIAKWFSLVLFDGGALVWLGVYVYKAKGTPQRGVSLLVLVFDLAGIVLMAVGGVYLGGQELAAIPEGLGGALVNGVIGATIANLLAGYYYHANDPDNRERIALQHFNDTVFEESLKQAERTVKAHAREHGAIMALGLLAQFKYDLGLPMTKAEKAALTDDVIDAKAVNIPMLEAPAPRVWPAWMIAATRFLKLYKPANIANPTAPAPETRENSTDTQSEA